MKLSQKKFITLASYLTVLGLLTGFIFYFTVVNTDSFFYALAVSLNSTTNIFSVLFGWQWIFLAIGAVILLVKSLKKRNKACRQAALIVLASLAIVLVPAQIIYYKVSYITGEGGPSGPDFACLIWDNSDPYLLDAQEGTLMPSSCTFMSIPSFNKFLIDRSYAADQTDASPSYYTMLLINEAILVGGIVLAARRLPAS